MQLPNIYHRLCYDNLGGMPNEHHQRNCLTSMSHSINSSAIGSEDCDKH